jgi:hypothetical protein
LYRERRDRVCIFTGDAHLPEGILPEIENCLSIGGKPGLLERALFCGACEAKCLEARAIALEQAKVVVERVGFIREDDKPRSICGEAGIVDKTPSNILRLSPEELTWGLLALGIYLKERLSAST